MDRLETVSYCPGSGAKEVGEGVEIPSSAINEISLF